MKILVVSNMYPSESDPSYGTFVRNFYEDLVARVGEASVRLVTIRGRRRSKAAKLGAYISFYARLLRQLLIRKYDLVYVHTVTFPTPALRVVSMFRRLPLVFNVHGDDVLPSNNFKTRLRDMSRPLVACARMIVAPSEYFKGVVCDVFSGIDPDKIVVSPSGGLNKKFYTGSVSPRPVDGSRPVVLGFVSRIDSGKGWETYLEALSSLRKQGMECRGIIAGGGAQAALLRREIERMELGEVVDYRGPVSQDVLARLYHEFDLFVFPSMRRAESLGLVGLEAMAAGVPVVACSMAGPSGYVQPGRNGYLFEPGSSKDLAEKIKLFMNLTPEQRMQMAARAYEDSLPYETTLVSERLYKDILKVLQ